MNFCIPHILTQVPKIPLHAWTHSFDLGEDCETLLQEVCLMDSVCLRPEEHCYENWTKQNTLHGPSVLPDKAKFVVCSIISLALSFWMKHLVIGQLQKPAKFSAFHW